MLQIMKYYIWNFSAGCQHGKLYATFA